MDARLVFGAFNLSSLMRRDTGRVHVLERVPYYGRCPCGLDLKWGTRAAMKASDLLSLMEFVHWRLA
ncbi:MAG: hypothetical protein H0X13_09810 [Ramlibacter sp.]|nr:hypothetical protein [Ramlibacter sp.]